MGTEKGGGKRLCCWERSWNIHGADMPRDATLHPEKNKSQRLWLALASRMRVSAIRLQCLCHMTESLSTSAVQCYDWLSSMSLVSNHRLNDGVFSVANRHPRPLVLCH